MPMSSSNQHTVWNNIEGKGQPLCLLALEKSLMTNINRDDTVYFTIITELNFYLDYTKHSIQRQICVGPELKRQRNISLKHDLFGCEWRKWL